MECGWMGKNVLFFFFLNLCFLTICVFSCLSEIIAEMRNPAGRGGGRVSCALRVHSCTFCTDNARCSQKKKKLHISSSCVLIPVMRRWLQKHIQNGIAITVKCEEEEKE